MEKQRKKINLRETITRIAAVTVGFGYLYVILFIFSGRSQAAMLMMAAFGGMVLMVLQGYNAHTSNWELAVYGFAVALVFLVGLAAFVGYGVPEFWLEGAFRFSMLFVVYTVDRFFNEAYFLRFGSERSDF